MRHRKTENAISLMGGALLGAAAMYLLDPDMGRRRRRYVADQAGDYIDRAGNVLQGGWDTVSDQARHVSAAVASKAQDYGQQLSDRAKDASSDWAGRARDAGSGWTDRIKDLGASLANKAAQLGSRGRKLVRGYGDHARDMADDYAGSAHDAADNITDYGNRLWKQVRHLGGRLSDRAREAAEDAGDMLPHRHSTPVVPVAVTAVGCCAIGVGLMYLMDPQRGRSRRAWLIDQTTSLFRNTGRSFYQTGRHLANRAYGVAAETRGRYASGEFSSDQLLNRVRSAMGHAVSHPRMIQVMTDANGAVTLSGIVLANESDRLIRAIEAVPGVSVVVNKLDLRNSDQEMTAASHSSQRVPQM